MTNLNRKAMSPIIASVLLIALVLVIAALVFGWSKDVILSLSPPVNCDGVSFRAEFFNSEGTSFLDVVNFGGVEVGGFVIESVSEGEVTVEEEIDLIVKTGETKRIQLTNYYVGKLLVIPKVFAETGGGDSFLGLCENSYGIFIEQQA